MVTIFKSQMRKYSKRIKEGKKSNFLIPNGYYEVRVTGHNKVPYKKMPGYMVSITFEVDGGKHDGKSFYEFYNIEHPTSDAAVEFAWCNLVRLTEAAGMRPEDVENIDMFLDKTLIVRVGSKKNEGYPRKNVIKEYVAQEPSFKHTNGKAPTSSNNIYSEKFEESRIEDMDLEDNAW